MSENNDENDNEDKVTGIQLPIGVPHPAAVSAYEYISRIPLIEITRWRESFASALLADPDSLLAEFCLSTIDRMLAGYPVGDRFILGLAWTIRNMIEKEG